MSYNGIYTDFMHDLEQYFNSKLPSFPKHEMQEMSAYITNRVCVLANDLMRERDRELTRTKPIYRDYTPSKKYTNVEGEK